ncbi:MAG: hypothetical protein R2839_02275 [Thermomicrobiales bacterium]
MSAINVRSRGVRLGSYRILVSGVICRSSWSRSGHSLLPERFLERFPTVRDLAAAPTADVIRMWAGLEFDRRAINLQRAAIAVVEQFDGVFPDSVDALRRLPGIGEYTAGAVACFAFDQDVAFHKEPRHAASSRSCANRGFWRPGQPSVNPRNAWSPPAAPGDGIRR